MFRLVTIEEVVQVPPRLFGLPRFEAMEHEVNRKYSNKVLSGVGICVALWDWLSAEDHRLVPHSGDANTRCKFRMLVFAPLPGEVHWGYVNSVSEDGLAIDVDFMGGIFVSKVDLPGRATYDSEERAWRISFEAGNDEEAVETFLDVGNSVAFRVLRLTFTDGVDKPPEDLSKKVKAGPIVSIKASLKDQGLGRYEWWAGEDGAGPFDADEEDTGDVGEDEEIVATEHGAEAVTHGDVRGAVVMNDGDG
jgi:DNA-directed RNA polymerase III subunit RPC8